MSARTNPGPSRGFTLLELLVVVGLIGILVAMLGPALARAMTKARQISCTSNLRQLGIAFHGFAHDHRSQFPQNVSTADGGALEANGVSPSVAGTFVANLHAFRVLSNYVGNPRILVCPGSKAQTSAQTFFGLTYTNLSYFVSVQAQFDQPLSILSGDNNLRLDPHRLTAASGLSNLVWTADRHIERGNVLFSDAHVETLRSIARQNQARSGNPGYPTPSASSGGGNGSSSGGRSSGDSDQGASGGGGGGSGGSPSGTSSRGGGANDGRLAMNFVDVKTRAEPSVPLNSQPSQPGQTTLLPQPAPVPRPIPPMAAAQPPSPRIRSAVPTPEIVTINWLLYVYLLAVLVGLMSIVRWWWTNH